jgi:hypothetical protein
MGGLYLKAEPDIEFAVFFQRTQSAAAIRVVFVEGCHELLLADGFASIGKKYLCLQWRAKCSEDRQSQQYFFH